MTGFKMLKKEARSKRGYTSNCDSDHFLVHIKIKQKLIPDKSKSINGIDNC